MLQNVVVAAIILGIPIGLFLLRTQAALVTLALYAGYWLSKTVQDDVLMVIGGIVKTNAYVDDGVSAALLIIPSLIIALHYRSSSASKLLLQLVPMLLAGLVTLFLVLNLLSPPARQFLENSRVFSEVKTYNDLAVAASVLISMLVLVALYKGSKDEGRHGKKHK